MKFFCLHTRIHVCINPECYTRKIVCPECNQTLTLEEAKQRAGVDVTLSKKELENIDGDEDEY
jgi:hypothetical protein